jgi:hypothetical protein
LGLEKIIGEDIVKFFNRNYIVDNDGQIKKMKLSSTDNYQKVIKELTGIYVGAKYPAILGNAGGGDAILSLYANLASVTHKSFPPQMLVVDRKTENLDVFLFKLLLTQLNSSRVGYVKDLFGCKDDDLSSNFLIGEKKVLSSIKELEYDPTEHYTLLEKKIFDGRRNLTEENRFFLASSVKRVTQRINEGDNYKQFVTGMFSSLKDNREVHYLSSDLLFKMVQETINFKENRYLIHLIREDMSTVSGHNLIRGLIEDYSALDDKVRPIDIALIQNLMIDFDNLVPYLENESAFTIYCEKDSKDKRHWVLSESSDLVPAVKSIPGLNKYKQDLKARIPITGLSQLPVAEGIEPTMFLSSPHIGNIYTDESMLLDLQEIANQRGVKKLIISNAIIGPCVYRNKDMRMLTDPQYKSFDSQLRAFKIWVNGFSADTIDYIAGESDFYICADLRTLHSKVEKEQNTQKATPGLTISQREEDFMTINDEPLRIISQWFYPFCLKLGYDPTQFSGEVQLGKKTVRRGDTSKEPPSIVEFVQLFKRYEQDKKPTMRDNDIMNTTFDYITKKTYWNLLEDNSGFRVHFDYSTFAERERLSQKDKNSIDGHIDSKVSTDIRALSNTKYSGKTSYATPEDIIQDLLTYSKGDTLEEQIPEQILADLQNAYHVFKIQKGKAIIMVPHMQDDRRHLDSEFSTPIFKNKPCNFSHKRITQNKRFNVPGATVITGDPEERMYVELYCPNIIKKIKDRGITRDKDITVTLLHDTQVGSLTERLKMNVLSQDYGINKLGSSVVIGIGDRIQGRNYPDMPNENAFLGGHTIYNQQQIMVALSRPFFTNPNVRLWYEVEGNHEWNSDKLYHGIHYLEPLRQAIAQHVYETGHDLVYRFPVYNRLPNGDITKASIGLIEVNGYRIAFSHLFSHMGMGKGKKTTPTTFATNFKHKMANLAKGIDNLYQGHHHQTEIYQEGDVIAFMLGAQAGESGFEMKGQYVSDPRVAYVKYCKDGLITAEILSEKALLKHEIIEPEIKAKGLDNWIKEQIAVDVVDFYTGKGNPTQDIFNRMPNLLDAPIIK